MHTAIHRAGVCRPIPAPRSIQRHHGAPGRFIPAISSSTRLRVQAAGTEGDLAGELMAVCQEIEACEDELNVMPKSDPDRLVLLQRLLALEQQRTTDLLLLVLQQGQDPGGADGLSMRDTERTANLEALEGFAKDVCALSRQLFPADRVQPGPNVVMPDLSGLCNTCLRLANTPSRLIPPALSRDLLIRESYLEVLMDLWRQPEDFAVVLTGTPGIGKRTFELFLICWLAVQQQKVLYNYQSEDTGDTDILLDFTDPDNVKVDIAWRDRNEIYRLLHVRLDPTVWRVIDGRAPPNVQYSGRGRVIVLTSPNPDNWKEYVKAGRTYVWYLPVWSLEELQACHKLLHTGLQCDVRQRYHDFGGMAQYVIGDKVHMPFEALAGSLTSGQADALYQVRVEGIDRDLRNIFAHIAVGKDHQFAGFFLGSHKMRALVYDKAHHVFWRDLVTLPKPSGYMPWLGTMANDLLAEHGHRMLQQGLKLASEKLPRPLSSQNQVRPSDQPQPLTEQQTAVQSKIVQALAQTKHRVFDSSSLEIGKLSGYYILADTVNNPGWHSLICDDDAVYAVRLTCNTQHGLLAKAYVELRSRVPEGMAVHVLLVVPDVLFKKYPWQSWAEGGTVLKHDDVPSVLKSVQQWAVPLEPPSGPTLSPQSSDICEAASASHLGDDDGWHCG